MTVHNFINRKSGQLAYYLRAFWDKKIPYAELDIYFWDIMEEWALVGDQFEVPYSQKERVFWHVLHQLHYWDELKLLKDPFLRDELETCLVYLEGKGVFPLDCIGIRP